jgi:RNA polymerase sigma factor (sigma-70 family)
LNYVHDDDVGAKFRWQNPPSWRNGCHYPTVSESASSPISSAPPGVAVPEEQSRWFAAEVQPHHSHLTAYLRRAYPSVRDTDDVVQETYLRIWKARALQPIQSAKAYLFRIARNLALDAIRRGRTSPIDAMPDLAALPVMDQGAATAETVCANEEIALLAEALEALPPRIREIVILRKFQNLPQKVVAERLHISELTVQEQVYRGLRRIEKILVKRGVIRPWNHE